MRWYEMEEKTREELGKPDLETESFRAWGVPKGEIPSELEGPQAGKFEINLAEHGLTNDTSISITCMGFNIGRDESGIVMAAFKIKEEDDGSQTLIYYINPKLSEEEKEKHRIIFATGCKLCRVGMVDLLDTIKSVLPELPTLERIQQLKDQGKSNEIQEDGTAAANK